MSELKEDKNAEFDDMYVPCVKLVRQARRNLLGKTKPGGFAFEMALLTACEERLVTPTNSMAELFTSALEGIVDVLARIVDEDFKIPDPSMDGETLEFDAGADFEKARDKFVTAAADARAAYDMDEAKAGKAALLLQGILGGNGDFEDVFPMPAGFDENGDSTSENSRKSGDLKPTPGPLRFG